MWFAGDTGYKSVPRGSTTEDGLPTCPAFKEIGDRFGGFDLSMIPVRHSSPLARVLSDVRRLTVLMCLSRSELTRPAG